MTGAPRRRGAVGGSAAVALASLAIAGCGGGPDPSASAPPEQPAPTATSPQGSGTDRSAERPSIGSVPRSATSGASPAAVRVAEAWFAAVRRGRPSRAAALMVDGTRYSNGDAPIVLGDRRAREAVVRQLPCGATPTAAGGARGGYVVLELRLGPLDGTPCAAQGARVAVAMRIRDGRIDDWVRLPDPGGRSRVTPGIEA